MIKYKQGNLFTDPNQLIQHVLSFNYKLEPCCLRNKIKQMNTIYLYDKRPNYIVIYLFQ